MAFENLTVEAPDFDRIRKESGVHTADATRLLWYAINDTRSQVRKVQAQLQWIDVPYKASNYTTPSGGTWTVGSGDQIIYKYVLFGDIMMLWVRIALSTTAGSPPTLGVRIPRGLIAPALLAPIGAVAWAAGTADDVGFAYTDSGTPDQIILISNSNGDIWPNATDTLNLGFTCMFQVQQV